MSDDDIGYGKPPKKNQFQPRQSGNPKGRPKGSKNFLTLVSEAAAQKIKVTENGRQSYRSKGETAATQLVNKAAAGDMRAIPMLSNHLADIDAKREAMTANSFPLGEAEMELLAQLRERLDHYNKGEHDV